MPIKRSTPYRGKEISAVWLDEARSWTALEAEALTRVEARIMDENRKLRFELAELRVNVMKLATTPAKT